MEDNWFKQAPLLYLAKAGHGVGAVCDAKKTIPPTVINFSKARPFKKGFSEKGELLDGDLFRAVGKIDVVQLTFSGTVNCGEYQIGKPNDALPLLQEPGMPWWCCNCTATLSLAVQIQDKYDFITTLPPTEKRRSAFWCAAVLEHAGRNVFDIKSPKIKVKNYTADFHVCSALPDPDLGIAQQCPDTGTPVWPIA